MNKHAQALGRLGGLKGGKTTGKTKRRSTSFNSELAKKALEIRWAKWRAAKTKAK
jgi:hypothetical protein